MAHLSSIFTRRTVDIPNKSGYDLSFENLLTMKCGTLTPVVCEEMLPGDKVSLGFRGVIQLPPMATNFFGRVDLRLEAFFVPNRILWGGWQNFWTMPANNPYGTPTIRPSATPSWAANGMGDESFLKKFNRGSLADFLGVKISPVSVQSGSSGGPYSYSIPNILPFVAYHKIYDEWYRNSRIQKPVFVNGTSGLKNLPWITSGYEYTSTVNDEAITLGDGKTLFDLRQRNWAKDYFTTAQLYPQANGQVNGASVKFDTSQTNGEISISALRSANVLQRWYERNNIAGERYSDQIKAQYGILPADAFIDRPLFLGGSKVGIYSNSVSATASSSKDSNNGNPYIGQLGAKGGQCQGVGEDSLIDSFTASEHGYIMVLASIVPHAYYGTGMRRQMMHSKVGDFAIPLLQGLGDQPIYNRELADFTRASGSSVNTSIFGYTVQHAEYKYHDDEVHGLLAPGQSLEAFALTRSFGSTLDSYPALGTDFLQIPTNFLNQVLAVQSDDSQAWCDFAFSFKKVSSLSEYVIPTLGDLTNTHKESIPLGGRQL